MAKVMVSLPDDLLRAVDIEADRRGTTRSGLLRELAEETLRRRSAHRAERMAEISHRIGAAVGHGGNVAELVKSTRPNHGTYGTWTPVSCWRARTPTTRTTKTPPFARG